MAQNTVLVFGDSLSAAYGIAEENGWVTLLEEKLAKTHPNGRSATPASAAKPPAAAYAASTKPSSITPRKSSSSNSAATTA